MEPRHCDLCRTLLPHRPPSQTKKPHQFCSHSCANVFRGRKVKYPDEKSAFMSFVAITDGCWLWKGATHKETGYGLYNRLEPKIIVRAHRLSWEFHYGEIPCGQQVLHRCDVRACVRPEHLFLGDNLLNRADMVLKGRQKNGPNAPRCWGKRRLTDTLSSSPR